MKKCRKNELIADIKTFYETTWYDISLKLPPEVEDELMDKSLDEAEEILLQLKEMLPGDAEIEEGLGMLAQMRGL